MLVGFGEMLVGFGQMLVGLEEKLGMTPDAHLYLGEKLGMAPDAHLALWRRTHPPVFALVCHHGPDGHTTPPSLSCLDQIAFDYETTQQSH